MSTEPRVILLSMPFGALGRPALGISLLKAELARRGVGCDVRYLTFPFAEFIGADAYHWINHELPHTAFAGDWCFTADLYGHSPGADDRYVTEELRRRWGFDSSSVSRLRRARSLAAHFLDYCMQVVPWDRYAIAGFTSTFEQNVASLALARRAKEARPGLATVFGGANWEGEMGLELHRTFPFVDFVCSGEAERSFPALVERILCPGSGGTPDGCGRGLKGVVYRNGDHSLFTGPPEPVRHMDELPVPDYSDYFRDLSQSTASAEVVPTVLLETSRGCWWGAQSHCTFCGLNGGSMAFRSKSAHRALDELEFLVDRWQTDLVEAVDNILDMRYFTDVLPALARSGRSVRLFYEVKANLTRRQVRLLRDAGVYRVQPGIESMSDHVLKLMRKGTTALRNIQVLKWFREYGVAADWNVLYGFPGETREDYTGQLPLFDAIRFLQPPCACGPIRLDRFSPYFNDPESFGLRNVRPITAYRHLYPTVGEAERGRIAYYFDFDYEAAAEPRGFADEVVRYVDAWRARPETGELRSVARADGSLVLVDTRSDAAAPQFVLGPVEREAYEYCDELRSLEGVVRHVSDAFPEVPPDEAGVRSFLDSLVANRLMVSDGRHYLSLALRTSPVEARQARGGQEPASERRPASSYLKPELVVLSA